MCVRTCAFISYKTTENEKWVKKMSIGTLKRQHTSNNYIQRCSFSLVIRNIESVTKLSAGEDVEQWNVHIIMAGVQTGTITMKSVAFSGKS